MEQSAQHPSSLLRRVLASYENPRLENDARDYFSPSHIEQLRNDSEIVVWDQYTEPITVEGAGTLVRTGIQTAQGYTYDTLIGIPAQPQCDVPVIGTTAWTTSLRGHNEHLVRRLMRNGNYVMFVGAEGSYLTDSSPPPTSPITLANSAATVLNFSYHMVQELRQSGHTLDESHRLCVGESRGGMVAEGIDALAEEFAQDILFADQIAPCLPEKLRSVQEVYRLAEQIVKEPIEIYRLLGSLTLAHLKYYPRSLDVRLNCLGTQAVIGGALFSGETGAMSRHVPGTTLKHLTVFDNDFASNRSWWEQRYDKTPLTRITPLRGGHMTIADLETLRYVLGRNKAAQDFINSGTALTTTLFDQSHHYVAALQRAA